MYCKDATLQSCAVSLSVVEALCVAGDLLQDGILPQEVSAPFTIAAVGAKTAAVQHFEGSCSGRDFLKDLSSVVFYGHSVLLSGLACSDANLQKHFRPST